MQAICANRVFAQTFWQCRVLFARLRKLLAWNQNSLIFCAQAANACAVWVLACTNKLQYYSELTPCGCASPGRIVWPQVRQTYTSQTEKFSRYTPILYFSPIQYWRNCRKICQTVSDRPKIMEKFSRKWTCSSTWVPAVIICSTIDHAMSSKGTAEEQLFLIEFTEGYL